MARPVKCRRICRYPCIKEFSPQNGRDDKQVILSYDEFETIRLIDREGLSQEKCGEYLRVGRTTVQKIYDSARKKIAEALTEGLPLKISGGDVSLCNGFNSFCEGKNCIKKYKASKKGEQNMRIAVTFADGEVSATSVTLKSLKFMMWRRTVLSAVRLLTQTVRGTERSRIF